jgi:hypothetical protein
VRSGARAGAQMGSACRKPKLAIALGNVVGLKKERSSSVADRRESWLHRRSLDVPVGTFELASGSGRET